MRYSQFQKLLQQINYLRSVSSMRNAKTKKRTIDQSPLFKPHTSSATSRFSIKFQLTKNNLSCFIGDKKQNKKTIPKRQLSRKSRKLSIPKKISVQTKPQGQHEKSLEKKRQDQSPDIIKDSLNSILSEIQNKGLKHQWKDPENHTGTAELQHINEEDSYIWSSFSLNDSFQKSYASTVDYQLPVYYHSADLGENVFSYGYKQRSQSFDGMSNEIRLNEIGYDARTTIMIRHIPNKYTINDLSEEIDKYFYSAYDFLYLPCDLTNQCNVGYGFINFVNTSYLRDFYLAFHKYRWTKFKSQKICGLAYARLQGLDSLIQHFENSKVLNSKEKKYRPIIRSNSKINDLIKNQQQK